MDKRGVFGISGSVTFDVARLGELSKVTVFISFCVLCYLLSNEYIILGLGWEKQVVLT